MELLDRIEIKCSLKEDVEALINIARPKLIAADNGGGSTLFNEVSDEFGPIAHRVFLGLDRFGREPEFYHDSDSHVLLDPLTILNRSRDLTGTSIDDVQFWRHGDMIKTLCDFLLLKFPEVINA